MNRQRNAMIFAAGLGTRMGTLTLERPKPLLSVGATTLIDHALGLCTPEYVALKVVNIHHHPDQLRRHLSRHTVSISDETDQLLETGGGLRKALPILGAAPVYTLNSDMVWQGDNPLATLAEAWQDRMEALLLLIPGATALGRTGKGDFGIDREGRLTRGGAYIYSGAQILRTDGLAAIPDDVFSLNLLWDQMARRGGLFGAIYGGTWCDVGTPAGLACARDLLAGTRDD